MTTLTPRDWHYRFSQQAGWTHSLREYAYTQLNIKPEATILEVGCGTGVILSDLHTHFPLAASIGLDIDLSRLNFAREHTSTINLTCGDAFSLPFPDGCFDAVVCHYLLLWLPDQLFAIKEMCRVSKPGGYITALAEPDYGGRIDYPQELMELGKHQKQSLCQQGADIIIGRKLRQLFHDAGLIDIQSGLLGGQWKDSPPEDFIRSEWTILRADLKDIISEAELDHLQRLDTQAWKQGARTLFLPTFYAWGSVP